jgi:RNA polymerase sigma factor (sigma-70 family)
MGAGMRNSLGRNHSEDHNTEAEELAAKAARGDVAAFEALYEKYNGFVRNTASHVVERREDVEDVSQQVWSKLYFKLQHYAPTNKFTTWLYKVTTNAAIDYLRRIHRIREVPLEAMEEEEGQQVIENHGYVYIHFSEVYS